MRVRIFLGIFLVLITYNGLSGQKSDKKITITGYVTDETGASIANAIIIVDGERTNTATDRKGFYKIKARQRDNKIGVFTFTDGIIEELIGGRKRIDFKFRGTVPDQKSAEIDPGDEPIDIGYTVVKRKSVTASVGKIDGSNPKYASYSTIYEMIRGEVPGVHVNGNSIMIRGATTLYGSTEPLFIVDGVPVITIDNIQPQMVKSIEVLKGSAASIYGARGSNGVILINLITGMDR
jgi:TonB-dependent SusC/RagA subfamily outer membrane receptor